VVLDNASFHKSARTQELIENAHCTLKFLPTYSPDMNPIENCWAVIKARIRRDRFPGQPLEEALDYALTNP